MRHPHGMEGGRPCVYHVTACVSWCVCAGGAECPLLSKQQKCQPPPWCVLWACWTFYLIQGPDFKNGHNAAKPFIFNSATRHAVSQCQHRGAVRGNGASSCPAKTNHYAGRGERGLKTTEKSDVSDKQMYNAKAARGTIWNHNRGMQDRDCKMNDELLYREFKSLSLVQEDCF